MYGVLSARFSLKGQVRVADWYEVPWVHSIVLESEELAFGQPGAPEVLADAHALSGPLSGLRLRLADVLADVPARFAVRLSDVDDCCAGQLCPDPFNVGMG